MSEHRYDAFISYSRNDQAIAERLQRKLESLKLPPPREKAPLRVFLDTAELSASPKLSDDLREALEQSHYLIVVASPSSLQSRWVGNEIRYWLELGRRDRLMCLLADGDPENILPELLRLEPDAEELPLAPDVRAESRRAARRRLETEYLRLAAPLVGVAYDDLRQRAQRLRLRRQRQVIAGLTAVLVVVLAAGGIAVWQWRVAESERRTAERRLEEAIGVADTVLSEVDSELQGVTGAETLRLSLLAEASQMLDRLAEQDADRDELVSAQLAGRLRRARVATSYRDYALARQELSVAEHLLAALETETGRVRARALIARSRGELSLTREQYPEAARHFASAEEDARAWQAQGETAATAELAELLRLRGDAEAHARRWDAAAGHYEEAERLYASLRSADPGDAALRVGAAAVQDRLARVAEVRRRADEVIDRLRTAVELIDGVEGTGLPPDGLVQLAEIYDRLAGLSERWDQPALAESFDAKALDVAFALYVTSPQNARYRRALGDAWARLGARALERGDYSRARMLFALQVYMTEMLIRQDPGDIGLRETQVEAGSSLVEALLGENDEAAARTRFDLLARSIEEFAKATESTRSARETSFLVMAYTRMGESARQLEMPADRERYYSAALALAEDRFERAPEDETARLDLLIARANMILIAAGKNDSAAMRQHAEAADALLDDGLLLRGEERETVADIRRLLDDLLGRKPDE